MFPNEYSINAQIVIEQHTRRTKTNKKNYIFNATERKHYHLVQFLFCLKIVFWWMFMIVSAL